MRGSVSILKNTAVSALLLTASFTTFQADATQLCDANCNMELSFTGSGSLIANEAMTITFGSGAVFNLGDAGTINTNPDPGLPLDLTQPLVLNAGDSISFGSGGAFSLGSGGNIDYTDISLSGEGHAVFSTPTPGDNILIHNLSVANGFTVELQGNVVLDGTLDLWSDGSGNSAIPACNSEISGLTISSNDSGSLALAPPPPCPLTTGQISIGDVSGTGTLQINDQSITINPGSITLTPSDLIIADLTLTEVEGAAASADDSGDSEAAAVNFPLVLSLAALLLAGRRRSMAG